jgi:hypothetical protein
VRRLRQQYPKNPTPFRHRSERTRRAICRSALRCMIRRSFLSRDVNDGNGSQRVGTRRSSQVRWARRSDSNCRCAILFDLRRRRGCWGATVYPFAYGDRNAATRMAITIGAEVAGPRGRSEYCFSLSPTSLVVIEAGTKLVLPSPNGSAMSAAARTVPVLAGCLRNAKAVARKAITLAQGAAVAVIPAGERWPDGSLRPAIEDLIGAGAILDELTLSCSPEAEVAREVFRSARPSLAELIHGCVSGKS